MQQWIYTNSFYAVPQAQENVIFYVIPFILPNVQLSQVFAVQSYKDALGKLEFNYISSAFFGSVPNYPGLILLMVKLEA